MKNKSIFSWQFILLFVCCYIISFIVGCFIGNAIYYVLFTKQKEITMTKKDVHTEHCCFIHGCKYGEDNEIETEFSEPYIECTVVGKRREQSLPCGKTSVCYDKCDSNDSVESRE